MKQNTSNRPKCKCGNLTRIGKTVCRRCDPQSPKYRPIKAKKVKPKQVRKPREVGTALQPKDYYKYINSKAWERRRRLFYATYPRACGFCGSSENIHLHHMTYERLGQEWDADLMPLCEACHKRLHSIQKENKVSATQATKIFFSLWEGT